MKKQLKLALMAVSVMVSAEAVAQDVVDNQQEDDSEAGGTLDRITVTATRRATSLEKTPLAISALTNENLERANVASMADIAAEVTGLNIVNQGAGLHRPVIRGLQGVGDAQVNIYLDNTPITGSPGTANSAGRFSPEIVPVDMERVEVLRGPQGTLYGGGAMGGAIRYITNKPNTSEFEGQIGAGGSSTKGGLGYDANLVLNVPLVEDEVAVRFVGYRRDEEGWIDNVANGGTDVNDFKKQGFRLMVGWTPTDNFTLTGTYIAEQVDAGARNIVQTDLPDLSTRNPGFDAIDDDLTIVNVTAEYETDWADLVYSYSKYKRDLLYRYSAVVDLLGINPPNLGGSLLIQPQDVDTSVHEVRIVSKQNDSGFYWTAGAFYSERNAFGLSDVYNLDMEGNLILADAAGSPGGMEGDIASLTFRRSVDQTQVEKAIFGELSYDIDDRTTLTAGARVFEFENRDGGQALVLRGVARDPVDFPFIEASSSHDGQVFKARISREILDDSVIYASWSQGFRSGGVNVEAVTAGIDLLDTPLTFKPDKVNNYEIGFRGALNNGRLTVATAGFLIDWTDMFVNLKRTDIGAAGNIEFRANAGEAQIYGFEFETEALLTENLKVSAGATVLSGELGSDVQRFGDSVGALEGDELPFVPDYTFNVTAEYGWELSNDVRAYVWGGYRYTGPTTGDFNPFVIGTDGLVTDTPNIQYTEYGDYGVLNLKLGVEADTWSGAFTIGNVTDSRECTYLLRSSIRPEPGNCFVETPRSFGVQFTKSF